MTAGLETSPLEISGEGAAMLHEQLTPPVPSPLHETPEESQDAELTLDPESSVTTH